MQLNGKVLKVRPSSFTSRDGKTQIDMVYFDLYDRTAALVNCEMRKDDIELAEEMHVIADVTRLKPTKFGSGISAVCTNVVQLDADGKPILVRPLADALGKSAPPAARAPAFAPEGERKK